MYHMQKICPALFLLGFLIPNVSLAADNPPAGSTAEERFAGLDKNGDAGVTWEELSAARPNLSRAAFDMIDTDHSGSISLAEWKTFYSGHEGGSGMRSMMQSMRGMGDMGKMPPSGAAMPLVMPPNAGSAPSASGMPKNPAGGKMPLVMPPKN